MLGHFPQLQVAAQAPHNHRALLLARCLRDLRRKCAALQLAVLGHAPRPVPLGFLRRVVLLNALRNVLRIREIDAEAGALGHLALALAARLAAPLPRRGELGPESVAASEVLLSHGRRPELRALATRVVDLRAPLARVSPCCCASRARRPSSSRPGEWAWGKEGEGEAPLPLRTKSSIELFGAIFLDRSLMRGSNEYSDCASASAALRRRSARSYSCAAAGSGRRGSEALGKQQIAWAWPTRGC